MAHWLKEKKTKMNLDYNQRKLKGPFSRCYCLPATHVFHWHVACLWGVPTHPGACPPCCGRPGSVQRALQELCLASFGAGVCLDGTAAHGPPSLTSPEQTHRCAAWGHRAARQRIGAKGFKLARIESRSSPSGKHLGMHPKHAWSRGSCAQCDPRAARSRNVVLHWYPGPATSVPTLAPPVEVWPLALRPEPTPPLCWGLVYLILSYKWFLF